VYEGMIEGDIVKNKSHCDTPGQGNKNISFFLSQTLWLKKEEEGPGLIITMSIIIGTSPAIT